MSNYDMPTATELAVGITSNGHIDHSLWKIDQYTGLWRYVRQGYLGAIPPEPAAVVAVIADSNPTTYGVFAPDNGATALLCDAIGAKLPIRLWRDH